MTPKTKVATAVASALVLVISFLATRPTTFKLKAAGNLVSEPGEAVFGGTIDFRNQLAEVIVKAEKYRGVVFLYDTKADNWRQGRMNLLTAKGSMLDCQFGVRDDHYGHGECTDERGAKYSLEIGSTWSM